MKRLLLVLSALMLATFAFAQRQITISFVETSDVHGNYLPYDFINGRPGEGGLARVCTYVEKLRNKQGKDRVVLLDNGDILQGQPTAYYYDYIDTTSTHLCAEVLNFMHYDAGTVGNHDVETGHAVYDRWVSQCRYPVLGANVIDVRSGKPYWKPYTILKRQGVRIAVLGMITPCIPMWLPQNLWENLRFDDQEAIARQNMPEMQRQADVIVGLFHSGVGNDTVTTPRAEHAAVAVARRVPGFDVVFCGHDHREAHRLVQNVAGKEVLVLNPAANAHAVAQADVTLTLKGKKVIDKKVQGRVVSVLNEQPHAGFMQHFAKQYEAVRQFTSKRIGRSTAAMTTTPAFFGPSAFIDFIHQMQLDISGADISFAAPLAMDATIPEGDIHVRDMFNLYRYENMLYVMKLTGREVKDYLEYSYAHWTAQMHAPTDHMLLFRANAHELADAWQRLQYPSYNFDSAAGICYTVDLTKPVGQKITITQMADGTPFSLSKTYRCAVNSYRGNGGGYLLTKGAGIAADELPKRIVWSTDKDLRYYLMTRIEQMGTISPAPLNQWRFIPEDWATQAQKTDEKLLQSF